jgi:hypothetical protein
LQVISHLDDAAMKCVSEQHHRPAIRNGRLVEATWKAKLNWKHLASGYRPRRAERRSNRHGAGAAGVECDGAAYGAEARTCLVCYQ